MLLHAPRDSAVLYSLANISYWSEQHLCHFLTKINLSSMSLGALIDKWYYSLCRELNLAHNNVSKCVLLVLSIRALAKLCMWFVWECLTPTGGSHCCLLITQLCHSSWLRCSDLFLLLPNWLSKGSPDCCFLLNFFIGLLNFYGKWI